MATFSFLDTQAAIVGPGGAIAMGAGAGVAEEGITIEFTEEADTMVVGSDGTPMHSLNGSKAAKAIVRLLKTSPTNALLSAMYNFQRTSSSNWGKNTLVITDTARGDVYTCQQVAFEKFPSNTYAKHAGMIEWAFNVGVADPALALGI